MSTKFKITDEMVEQALERYTGKPPSDPDPTVAAVLEYAMDRAFMRAALEAVADQIAAQTWDEAEDVILDYLYEERHAMVPKITTWPTNPYKEQA